MCLCRCWLGTVSLTINLGVLQLTHPRKCRGLPGLFSCGEVGDFYIALNRYICRWLGTVSLTINLVLSHYNPCRCFCLPGSLLMVRGRSFCLHALLGVLLPTTLVHSQLHQKRLTRPTCVNNREHSTILFSHARCGAMFLELRSVGAWPISNTWYRPFLRAGTCVGCFS